MKISISTKNDPKGRVLLVYSLGRDQETCWPTAATRRGLKLHRYFTRRGLPYVAIEEGCGVLQVVPEDGAMFMAALLQASIQSRTLEILALDRQGTELRQSILRRMESEARWPAENVVGWSRRDVVLRRVVLARRDALGRVQKAPMTAAMRPTRKRKTLYYLVVPRFCSRKLAGMLPSPGRAVLRFRSRRELLRCYEIRLKRLNEPAPLPAKP